MSVAVALSSSVSSSSAFAFAAQSRSLALAQNTASVGNEPSDVTLQLLHMRATHPRELRLATGRMVLMLAEHPEGMNLAAMTRELYPKFDSASAQLRESLLQRVAKLAQRARVRFERFGIQVQFCKRQRTWRLESASKK